MAYQFDHIIDRRRTGSVKWDFIERGAGHEYEYKPVTGALPEEASRLPLWVADMDFASPQPVIDALTARAQHGVFGYSKAPDSYYETIVNWMQRRHNWAVKTDWILTTPGVVPAINYIIQTFTQPDEGVIIQTPVYHPFYSSIENNERRVVRNPLLVQDGRYEIDFDDLAAKAAAPDTTLIVLCSPHNPIGRVWTSAELQRIAAICAENDVLIVSDEIHHDLVYSWANFTSFGVACPDAVDRTIICTAPSKTFNLPGLKTANAIIPNPELRAAISATMLRNGVFGVSVFGLLALETAYAAGEPWLDALLPYIEDNYRFLEQFFAEQLPSVCVTKPEATYLVWLDFRDWGLDADSLNALLLHEAGVYLNNGTVFGEAGAGFMRMNIACSRSTLAEALQRIRQVAP